jgi:WASH complex subunit strumpellin
VCCAAFFFFFFFLIIFSPSVSLISYLYIIEEDLCLSTLSAIMSEEYGFLEPDNVAGQTLLQLVARGSAIIAELLRLSDHIPAVFLVSISKYVETYMFSLMQKLTQSVSLLLSCLVCVCVCVCVPLCVTTFFLCAFWCLDTPLLPLSLLPLLPLSLSLSLSFLPPQFQGTDEREVRRYAPILLDFRYLRSSELYDEKIDADADIVDLDEEFRETHLVLLERFYKLFESIYLYYRDFSTYLEEMTEGVYVQHTIEGVLVDVEGKQLMCEAMYLYGVMLLLMDIRIPGLTRERMVISFYRYKGAAAVSHLEEVCKLCRGTGFRGTLAKENRPEHYPETYFARYNFPKSIVNMVIGRLRSDDVYNRNQAYPSPEHRSTALATQSSMLYVILYFAPHLLDRKQAIMREIVDKHFNDNWVIPVYMGFTVDLSEAWDIYGAARLALANILDKENVSDVLHHHVDKVKSLVPTLDKYLVQGVLEEEYVLDNIRKLMHCVRDCNVTLRWFLLHRSTVLKRYREAIIKSIDVNDLLSMLMTTGQFEFILKEMFRQLIDSKQDRWTAAQTEAAERMIELSEYFSGEKALTRVKKNEKLQTWFKQMGDEIKGIDYDNSILAGRKIALLLQALEDVEEFHQIETSLQVKQFLGDTRGYLRKMIRTINVKQQTLGDLHIISDFSYAYSLIKQYTPVLHRKIKETPSIVLMLRSTFLKLSSILSAPLVRISQCESKDEISVAEYFSSSLVSYVRNVLSIVPRSVFATLDEITKLQTSRMASVPTKLERMHLKDIAQVDERYELARLTHQVSVFTEGVLSMKETLVGIITLDPKQLLEDGIRQQLVVQICNAMNQTLVFRSGQLEEFESRLRALATQLIGLRKSIEYIQDYISIYGLKIWQEELSRIVNYFVEQESNSFLKKQIYDWQSTYQSDAIPIPKFARIEERDRKNKNNQHFSVNFTGRLVREILQQTSPTRTVFVEAMQGWYDRSQTGREVVGIRTFDLLNRAVGVFGLTGADKLICFMIVRDLQRFTTLYTRSLDNKLRGFVSQFMQLLHPTSHLTPDASQTYAEALQLTQKLWPKFLEFVTNIGQKQLLRRMISNELNFTAKLDSRMLTSALGVMNKAVLNDVKTHYAKPDVHPYPSNLLLADLSSYLETAGINNPLTKIYITSDPIEGIPAIVFLLVLANVEKLRWDSRLCTLVNAASKGREPLDGAPFVVGVITLLKQFHSSHTSTFLAFMGQYVRSMIQESSTKSRKQAFPETVINVMHFLDQFCRFSKTSRAIVENVVPSYVFDRFMQ